MKEIEYIQVGDYQLPNLKVEEMHLNRFGRAKLDYLTRTGLPITPPVVKSNPK